MEFKCEHCGKEFKERYNLNKHQQSAKYCIQIQENEKKISLVDCKYCEKKVQNLEIHFNKCERKIFQDNLELTNKNILLTNENSLLKNNLEELKYRLEYSTVKLLEANSKYDELNKKYQESLEKLTIKAIENSGNKTTTNNIITNKNKIFNALQPLTTDYMLEQSKFLGIEHVKYGTQSLAQFAKDYTFKDRIAITDASRNKFVFKDENGNLISDPYGVKITDKFIEVNRDVLLDVLSKYIDVLKEKIHLYYQEQDLILIKKYEDEYFDIKFIYKTIKEGNNPENVKYYEKLKTDFVKYLTKMIETIE